MEQYLPDITTGEMINIFDPMVSIEKKADPISFYLDEIDLQIQQCTERKNLWNEKSNMLKQNKEKLREYLLKELIKTDEQKIKTLENTIYTTKKSKVKLFGSEDDLNEQCFDYSINITNLDFSTFTKIVEGLKKLNVKFLTDKKINLSNVPDDRKMTETIETLTIRKSANVKEQ